MPGHLPPSKRRRYNQAHPFKATGKRIRVKRCPFCGGKPMVYRVKGDPLGWWWLDCSTEGCIKFPSHFDSREEAAGRWNNRTWYRERSTEK